MSNEPVTSKAPVPSDVVARPRQLELVRMGPIAVSPAEVVQRPTTVREVAQRYWLFLLLVIAPIVGSLLYFGVIASDIYDSEAKFIIRSPNSPDAGSLGMLMRGETGNRTADETNAVYTFMISRDAAMILARDHGLRDLMSRGEGDIFARYPNFYSRDNDEQLYEAYKRFVSISVDSSTGISTLVVRAFRPDDAKKLADALLTRGESFVNTLRDRAARDELEFTRGLVAEARAQMEKVTSALADYRNQELTVDPAAESTSALAGLTKFATEIAQLEASLAQQIAMAPQSPGIAPLREKVRSLRNEMERQRRLLVGNSDSIATKFKDYELLMLERELAVRMLTTAVIQMETARQAGLKQSFYLQRIVEPNLPDYPAGPQRLLGVLLTIVLSTLTFWMAQTLLRQVMDHRS